jgi:predicted DCC family thiol-disulfide oxidoreductase YuxK
MTERATPTLLFDGRCGFCTWTVEWLRPRLRSPLRMVPFQAVVPESYGLTPAEVERSVWWVEPDGTRVRGAEAIARALTACGGPWVLVARLIEAPVLRWISALLYRLIGAVRTWLPGTEPAWPSGRLATGITVKVPART